MLRMAGIPAKRLGPELTSCGGPWCREICSVLFLKLFAIASNPCQCDDVRQGLYFQLFPLAVWFPHRWTCHYYAVSFLRCQSSKSSCMMTKLVPSTQTTLLHNFSQDKKCVHRCVLCVWCVCVLITEWEKVWYSKLHMKAQTPLYQADIADLFERVVVMTIFAYSHARQCLSWFGYLR